MWFVDRIGKQRLQRHTEGINRMMKLRARDAHGFRNPTNRRNAVQGIITMLVCSLLYGLDEEAVALQVLR